MLLSDAIDQYVADRRAKGVKPGTLRSEGRVLRYLLADVGNLHVTSLQPRHMDKYWAMRGVNWGPATFNRAKTQLNTFFKWCQVRGYMPRTMDLLEGVRKRRVPTVSRLIVPQSQFGELLDASDNARDRAIIAIGLYLFTRVSETSALRWQDLDFDNQTVRVWREKTETEDILPMCEELEQELRQWRLAYGASVGEVPRPSWFLTPPYSSPVFIGMSGGGLRMVEPGKLLADRRLSVVARPIKIALAKLNLDDMYEGGHTLRRSGAVALYHQLSSVGHDRAIRMCQAMLGHASIATTEIYLRLDLDRKARNDLLAGKRMFPETGEGQVFEIGALPGDQESGRAI